MNYLKINDREIPASFRQRIVDPDWDNRASIAITAEMAYEEAERLFVDGVAFQQMRKQQPFSGRNGQIVERDPVITRYPEYEIAGPITDNRDGTVTVKMGKALAKECNEVLTGKGCDLTVREVKQLRTRMEAVFDKAAPAMSADDVIENKFMCRKWEAGIHAVGEVYEVNGQVWQCIQGYDNAVYPDIVPNGSAWGTFHKPYHGRTVDTAMAWVAPTGAHDIYLTGEYMVWNDGQVYKCLQDTAYDPESYAPAWEVVV